jgi:MtaA/CmuA family methyltransferase
MEASGAYWPEAHHDPEIMAKLAMAAHTIAGIECVCVPFHNEYETTAMGGVLGGYKKDMFPSTVEYAVKSLADIDKLRVPDPKKDGELPIVLKAATILSKKLGGKVPVVGRIPDPFELANRLYGVTEVLTAVLEHPNELKKLLKIAVKVETEYGKALIASGATTITLVSGTTSTITDPETGPKYYMEFSQPYQKELIKNLKTSTVLHICGNCTPILNEMGDTGTSGVSIDSPVDVLKAKKVLGKRAAIVGNINALNILGSGTPDKVKEKAKEALMKGVDVLSSGCGFPPQTPLANMKALVEAGLEFCK